MSKFDAIQMAMRPTVTPCNWLCKIFSWQEVNANYILFIKPNREFISHRLLKMELPTSRRGKNGFDNPRSTRIKMRHACLERLALEYTARADCCSAGAICGKNPRFNPAPEKAVFSEPKSSNSQPKAATENAFVLSGFAEGTAHNRFCGVPASPNSARQ